MNPTIHVLPRNPLTDNWKGSCYCCISICNLFILFGKGINNENKIIQNISGFHWERDKNKNEITRNLVEFYLYFK